MFAINNLDDIELRDKIETTWKDMRQTLTQNNFFEWNWNLRRKISTFVYRN